MSVLTYNIDDDFTESDPNLSQLQDEINADVGISRNVLFIRRVDDNIISVIFDDNLSAGEITIVNGLITAHEAATVVGNYVVGDTNSGTNVRLQFSDGWLITTQPTPTSLADANRAVNPSQLKTRILRMIPTDDRIITTAIIGDDTLNANESVEFSVINEAAATHTITIQSNTGITLVGNPVIVANSSGHFRIIVTSGSTCLVIRL